MKYLHAHTLTLWRAIAAAGVEGLHCREIHARFAATLGAKCVSARLRNMRVSGYLRRSGDCGASRWHVTSRAPAGEHLPPCAVAPAAERPPAPPAPRRAAHRRYADWCAAPAPGQPDPPRSAPPRWVFDLAGRST